MENNENLREYKQKRNFERTLEPAGETEISKEGLYFVVQHHMARKEHYDLRLEWAGVLLSWAVPKGPSYNTQVRRLAVKVENHPLEYRNFEGTIPKGEYGGGVVMLWDEGFWEPYGNVEEGLEEGVLKFKLKGYRLKGKWALIRLKQKAGVKEDNWLLLKEKDAYVKYTDGTDEYKASIRTGRTMEEIERGEEDKYIKNPFDLADVQLAKLVKTVPHGEDWLYELKYDGYRIVAYVEGGMVRLLTRNGYDYAHRFYDIATALISLAKGRAMVLDGEMTVIDKDGKTDFQALQSYLKNPGGKKLTYIIFDLLALDGVDLRKKPLLDRKEMLEKLLADAPKNLYYSRYVRGKGKESFTAASQAGMEGIVGKRADSVYSGGRNGDWIKIKCDKRQEFIIAGYTRSEKRTGGISSLLLGVYEGEDLIYAGRAGTGISELQMKQLEEEFSKITVAEAPFKQAPKPGTAESFIWLKPELVAEIKFAEWTHDKLLRQASFKGLRTDKNPLDIRRERAEDETETEEEEAIEAEEKKEAEAGVKTGTDAEEKAKADTESTQAEDEPEHVQEAEIQILTKETELIISGVRITHPDKLIFDNPQLTKEDVIRYYAAVSERMLPLLSNRLISAIRCPKGINQTCFFKKHPGPGSREVVIMPVAVSEGGTEDYFYIENEAGLIEEAQMGTVEFHIWGSRVNNPELPDMMVFDLDPDEDMELSRVRQGVLDVREILNQLSLKAFLKTSGGKGYHVVVPFKTAASWDTFSDFARKVALVLEQKWPDRYTSNIKKKRRTGKIFIDWMRNVRGATSVAPYSLRARVGAKVSMPISWDELDLVAPDGISINDALERIKAEDPWRGFYEIEQSLK